jgi:hypothetical protein
MGRGEKGPDLAHRPCPQQAGDRLHAVVVGDDVPGTPAKYRVVEAPERRVRIGHVAQGADPEQPRGLLAGAAPVRVLAIGQRVPHPGVKDHEFQAGRSWVERHLGRRKRPAVEQQGVAFPAQQRRRLVHDPARHPDEVVLREPREPGKLRRWHLDPIQVRKGERGRALERCG